MKIKFSPAILSLLFLASVAAGQTGGAFAIEKSVIASGGGTSAGGAFTVEGTAGQSAAGVVQGAPFSISGGFATPAFAPTAAAASVSGRVFTPYGRGLANAFVMLTDGNGQTRAARTSTFGYYRFNDVETGQTYIFEVRSKRYQFAPQVVTITEDLEDLNFTAVP